MSSAASYSVLWCCCRQTRKYRPPCRQSPFVTGYDIKDAIIEQAETLKETCEDLAAEAKEKYEDRKAEEQKPAVTPAPTVVPEDSKKE